MCSCSTQSLIVQRNPVTVDHRTANLAASKGAVKKGGREGRGKERKGQHVGEKLVGRTEGTIEQQSSIMKVMAICTVRRSQTRRRTAAVRGILSVRRCRLTGFSVNTSEASRKAVGCWI